MYVILLYPQHIVWYYFLLVRASPGTNIHPGLVKYLGGQYFQGGMGVLAMELMCNITKPLWVTVKTYIMDSSLCVIKVLFGMIYIGICGSLLVKKFRNWKTGIHRYEMNAHSFYNT